MNKIAQIAAEQTTRAALPDLDLAQMLEHITGAAEYAARRKGSDLALAAYLLGALRHYESSDPRVRWTCDALGHVIDTYLEQMRLKSIAHAERLVS